MDIVEFLVSRGAQAESRPGVRNALSNVAGAGSLAGVKYLVEKAGYDINHPPHLSPLSHAFRKCRWDVAHYLVQAGADPTADWSQHDLSEALEETHQQKFRQALCSLLLQVKEKPLNPGLQHATFWAYLLGFADDNTVALIIERFEGYASVLGKNDTGFVSTWNTLATAAAASGNTRMLKKLLLGEYLPEWTEAGVEKMVSQKNWKRNMSMEIAILWALRGGQVESVELLLEHGYECFSNKLQRDNQVETCQWAVSLKQYAVIRKLLDRYPRLRRALKWTTMLAPLVADEECSRILLDYDLYRAFDAKELKECFLTACKHGNVKNLEIWLRILKDSKLTVRDCTADNPAITGTGKPIYKFLQCLVPTCDAEVFQLLVAHLRIALHSQGASLGKLLSFAAWHDNSDVVKLFLNNGFDVNEEYPTHENDTFPLLISAISAKDSKFLSRFPGSVGFATVKLLLDRGALADVVGKDDISALRLAVERDQMPIVKLLLDGGAEPHFCRGEQLAAIIFAAKEAKEEPLKMFLSFYERNSRGIMISHPVIPEYEDSAFRLAKAFRQHVWRCKHPL